MMNQYIDLHVHTTASDGSMTPSEVVRYAAKKDLSAIAITDHDTIAGVEEAYIVGNKVGVEVISGIEISVHDKQELHILGYFVDLHSNELNITLDRLKEYREKRNPRIIEKLNGLGMDISMSEVKQIAGTGVVGRPHIAQIMVQKGYVGSVDEAFSKYLDNGKLAYVERQKLLPQDGISLIKKSGGLAVLAHPIYLRKEDDELEVLLAQLIDYGLDGIEAYYSEYPADISRKYRALAKRLNLVITGGSDFHGKSKPDLDLGIGYGSLRIPYELIYDLKRRVKEEVH
ncbi:PHP domain-containing protein [Petroclostridium sp. X23]|uniref:PHP domain-containing protein n=1 Tax=Petroclostridium sp. X23 TaxID=3045146 RepID=UPI0032C10F7E